MELPFHVLLVKALTAHKNAVAPYLTKEGLSPGQPKILTYLMQHDQCMQRELADYYAIEPATVSRILVNMEEQGLLRRCSRQEDKRAAAVAITRQGREAFDRMQVHYKELEAKELDGFSTKEREEFRAFIERMYQNLTGEEVK